MPETREGAPRRWTLEPDTIDEGPEYVFADGPHLPLAEAERVPVREDAVYAEDLEKAARAISEWTWAATHELGPEARAELATLVLDAVFGGPDAS